MCGALFIFTSDEKKAAAAAHGKSEVCGWTLGTRSRERRRVGGRKAALGGALVVHRNVRWRIIASTTCWAPLTGAVTCA